MTGEYLLTPVYKTAVPLPTKRTYTQSANTHPDPIIQLCKKCLSVTDLLCFHVYDANTYDAFCHNKLMYFVELLLFQI